MSKHLDSPSQVCGFFFLEMHKSELLDCILHFSHEKELHYSNERFKERLQFSCI